MTNVIDARNVRELQVGYLATNGTRTTYYSMYLYTNAGVLVPYITFYDAKPQTKHNITKSHMPMFITNTKST